VVPIAATLRDEPARQGRAGQRGSGHGRADDHELAAARAERAGMHTDAEEQRPFGEPVVERRHGRSQDRGGAAAGASRPTPTSVAMMPIWLTLE
jgi:hypothetical protein